MPTSGQLGRSSWTAQRDQRVIFHCLMGSWQVEAAPSRKCRCRSVIFNAASHRVHLDALAMKTSRDRLLLLTVG